MHRLGSWIIPAVLLISMPVLGQSASTDSQTLRSLLLEVRQLRHDLQTATSTVQETQILFYRLQVEEAAVARATQRLDDTRAKLEETQTRREELAAHVKQNEDLANNADNLPDAQKQAENEISRGQPELERLGAEEQQRQSRETEAEEQLRLEQTKLSELQDQLERLEKNLQGIRQQTATGSR